MNLEQLYSACHIHELTGLSLHDFADNPTLGLALAHQEQACESIQAGHRPLLPAQVRVMQKLEDAAAVASMERLPAGHMESRHGMPKRTVVPYAIFRRRMATKNRP